MNEETQFRIVSRVNIGMYGCQEAGKTQFLRGLFRVWEKGRKIRSSSRDFKKFMNITDEEIRQFGQLTRTKSSLEEIWVQVDNDTDGSLHEYQFRDLRGEELARNIDALVEGQRSSKEASYKDYLGPQVIACDGFLFFFDPSARHQGQTIDEHHQRELKRAKIFIEHILKVRENRYLPIIFIQTHLDLWENDDEISKRAALWNDNVHALMSELYVSHLRGIHPRSIVDSGRIAFNVSSIGKTEESDRYLVKVFEQMAELILDAELHNRQLKKTGLWALIGAGVAAVAMLLAGSLFFFSGEQTSQKNNTVSRIAIAEYSEQDIIQKLDELDRILRVHPRGTKLPAVDEAKRVNEHLNWLSQRLELGYSKDADISEDTRKRMRSALDSVASLVFECAKNRVASLPVHVPVIAAYLEDLPDLHSVSESLGQTQTLFWQMKRAFVVDQLAGIIRRRQQVGSSPIDTLAEIEETLRGFESDITVCNVYGPKNREKLIEEVKTAITFCEDRRKSGNYETTIEIKGTLDRADDRYHNLRISSPGQSDTFSLDGIELKPRVQGGKTRYETRKPEYDIRLGLGAPIRMILGVYDSEKQKWSTVLEFDVTNSNTERSALETIGMPIIDVNQTILRLQEEGYHLDIAFSKFSRVPSVLSEAASLAKERKQ